MASSIETATAGLSGVFEVPPAGTAVKTICVAGPQVTAIGALTAAVSAPELAVSLVPVPILPRCRPLKLATPATGFTAVIPVSASAFGLVLMSSETPMPQGTVFPPASCTSTVAPKATCAITDVGIEVMASLVALPTSTLKVLLKACASVPEVALS